MRKFFKEKKLGVRDFSAGREAETEREADSRAEDFFEGDFIEGIFEEDIFEEDVFEEDAGENWSERGEGAGFIEEVTGLRDFMSIETDGRLT